MRDWAIDNPCEMLASLSSSCSNVSISSETASITASEFEYNASAIVTSMFIFVELNIFCSFTAPISLALHQDSSDLSEMAAIRWLIFSPPDEPPSSPSLNDSSKMGPMILLHTEGSSELITSFVPAGQPFPLASTDMCKIIATTACGGSCCESTPGTIQSVTKCRTAVGPDDTALHAKTPQNCSIATGSEKADVGCPAEEFVL
mmetsp:Transcript_8247/g.16759  ORF Transcript_8247/g.16759 Transcript_8247/m.16759 type:complete len:203 (+) Transcript_8247:3324-3932(+)